MALRLNPLGANKTELETGEARILFSYQTAVAALIYGKGYVRSSTKYSTTTSKHVNSWVGDECEEVDQATIDALL
jgi:hypothetical protein